MKNLKNHLSIHLLPQKRALEFSFQKPSIKMKSQNKQEREKER